MREALDARDNFVSLLERAGLLFLIVFPPQISRKSSRPQGAGPRQQLLPSTPPRKIARASRLAHAWRRRPRPTKLLGVVDELEASTERRSPELVRQGGEAYRRASMARCERKSALYSELPPIQIYACTVISWVLLGGFLLVDLGAPRFEAVLFATLACCFSLISSFVDDLADPFGGSWTVDAAKSEVEHLIAATAAGCS